MPIYLWKTKQQTGNISNSINIYSWRSTVTWTRTMSNPWQPQQLGSTQCRNGITKWQGSAASIVNLATPGELSLTLYSPEITQLIVWFVFYAGHCSATCNTIFVGSQYIWTHLVEMFGLFLMVYRGHEKLIHIYHYQTSIIWIPWNCIVENIKR